MLPKMNTELELLLAKKEIVELKVMLLQLQHKDLIDMIAAKQQELAVEQAK
jgi:hypothetical protein